MKKVGVIGLWHLGSVLCASWSKLGYEVVGFDYEKSRVDDLLNGISPVFEPNLNKTINYGLKNNTLNFSNNIEALNDCDFILLSYDTPVDNNDSCDLAILEKSVDDVASIMKDNSILIVSSQSPVGYCSNLEKILIKKNNTLNLAYSPENLRLGEAIECYLNPGRIILGTSNKETERRCLSFLKSITDNILTMNIESSEVVKHGINSFLALSVVFANNLSDICEESGANINDVVNGLKSDIRIGKKAYLSPGIGFSGGTLGRDLKVLDDFNTKKSGHANLFGHIHKANLERKTIITKKIVKLLRNEKEKTVGILGLTYKPGTSTLRRSLPLEIVNLLMKEKISVKVFDPKADYTELNSEPKFIIAKDVDDVSSDVDLLILLTEWPEFKHLDWDIIKEKMKTPIIFDTKNFLDGKIIKENKITYYSLGGNNE